MKCETCKKDIKTLLQDRLICFSCRDKELRDKGFGPRFTFCIRHPETPKYLLSQGCPACGEAASAS